MVLRSTNLQVETLNENFNSYSVVIPTFNRNETLTRAIKSIYQQTLKASKVVVVDDGSTDSTPESMQTFSEQSLPFRFEYIQLQTNKGVSHARNIGVKTCTTQWIAFLDSDDEWLPNKMQAQLRLAEQLPHAPLIHCNEKWLRLGSHLNQLKKHQKFGGRIFQKCLPLCVISPSAAVIRSELLDEYPFDEDFPVCEDYDLWLQITSKYDVGFVDEPLIVKHGGHSDQLSTQYVAMDYWRIKAMMKHLDSTFLSQVELQELVKEALKKCKILLKGYVKHQNLANYNEVQIWEKYISSFL
jgi:glycosyltransferase involved in cell wall biosynthesis